MDDMSPQAQPERVVKPSAIPRPGLSRLPVPKASITNLRQHATTSSSDKPSTASTATLRGKPGSTLPRNRAPLSSTQSNSRAPIHSRAPSTASQDGLFKKPNPRPLSRLPPKSRQVSGSSGQSNTEDELASLSSFRSASQASSHDTMSYNGFSPLQSPITPVAKKASRPSLSERTIGTLANMTPSPALRRRKSSFFAPDSPMAPLSRPASSMAYNSRPNSQDGGIPAIPSFAPKTIAPQPINTKLANSKATPSKRSVSTLSRAHSPTKSSLLKGAEKEPSLSASTRSTARGPFRGTKTISGRMQQARPAVADLFAPPSAASTPKQPIKKFIKKPAPTVEEANPSPKAAQASKSSAALREQIRAAKAARASLGAQQNGTNNTAAVPEFNPSAFTDPFNTKPKDERSIIQKKVDIARTEGRLNISAMNLKEIPEQVLKMYDSEFNKESEIPWNEVVDLVRFVAADNDIETIPDEAFPDVDPEAMSYDDDSKGPQFGGLEVLDLHGNVLFDVPPGLKRMQCLTTLNLSRNRLMNDALETIAQISSLRELKIADNLLTGELTSIEQLHNLEVLDVQGNKLSLLPDEINNLSKLRILNVSNNQLMDLPMNELSKIQLVELHASKNKLSGTLFTTAGTTMSRLQVLDISINAISTLYDGSAGPELPALHTLNIAFNQISSLPDITTWTSLVTILAEANKVTELPLGFTDSASLKTVDFTSNDLTKLDERIALMDGLEALKIGGNSIRERKFLTMSMEDIKRDLRARLAPVSFME